MENRKASWYSIVRYVADNLTGETINVGVILHVLDNDGNSQIKHLLLQENSSKIKAITESQADQRLYKSYKDNIEYYLEESVDDLFGTVGNISIGSPADEKYLEMLYDSFEGKQLFITRPKFSLSGNVDGLFDNLFKTYVGSKYLITENNQVSTKKYFRQLLINKELLNKKVLDGYVISPIKELKNLEIKIDFCFKNGVWNYMQGVPTIAGPSQNVEWFTKTKFILENVDSDSKIQLLYREHERTNKDLDDMIKYFSNTGTNVIKVNVDDQNEIDALITQISTEAHDVDEYMIS